MSPAAKSKSKDKKAGKEPPKGSSKPSGNLNAGVSASGYNPVLGTFHTIEAAPASSVGVLQVNGRFRNIDETDDHSGNALTMTTEYDSVSNNGSWSGESEEHKEKTLHPPPHQESVPGADNDKREKIRQKNEKKHQRQKERRAQELHDRCSGYLMSRKLELLSQQLVAMGFSQERATIALMLNEGRVEESVVWLLEGGEEEKKDIEHNLDGGGNLKIDISEELAWITNTEIKYKASKQEVERAVVACEGDLEKAEETLKSQKQEPPYASLKTEENDQPQTVVNSKLPVSVAVSQSATGMQPKHPTSSTSLQQRKDEKDFNYTKLPATVGSTVEPGIKSIQPSRKIQSRFVAPAEKRWTGSGSSPSVSYSLASHTQVSPPPAKTEAQARYASIGNEFKNLQLGTVREPVVVMQRPQSMNARQTPPSIVSSAPTGTTVGWYPNTVEASKPHGFVPPVAVTRSVSSTGVGSNPNPMYNQLHYQPQQQFVSSSSSIDAQGTNRGNGLWSRAGACPTLAASSLGLFSGLGTNGPSGSSPPVDWSTGSSMSQLDYTSIDWSLERGSSAVGPGGIWSPHSMMQNNARTHNSFLYGLGVKSSMRPALSNASGGQHPALQNGMVSAEAGVGGSREWSSPFEEKDLFSLPRQFVSSPSL